MQQKQHYDGNNWVVDSSEYYLYGVMGHRLSAYYATTSGTSVTWTLRSTRVYFRGKVIQRGGNVTQEDRLGSVAKSYPYGEDRTTVGNDDIKFGTYTRDSMSELDYAINRYYAPGMGRFTSTDAFQASAGAGDPSSWNRYSYSNGDPVSKFDPAGLAGCDPDELLCLPEFGFCPGGIFGISLTFYGGSCPLVGGGLIYGLQWFQAPTITANQIWNKDLRDRTITGLANQTFANLNTDCAKLLTAHQINPASIASAVNSDQFNYQSVNTVGGSAAWYYGVGGFVINVTQWFTLNSDVTGFTAIPQGTTTNIAVMGPQYFGASGQTLAWITYVGLNQMQLQGLTIVHETLHMWLQGTPTGTTDMSLAATLGLGAFANQADASFAVTKALQAAHCY